jgi:hypothetical protein
MESYCMSDKAYVFGTLHSRTCRWVTAVLEITSAEVLQPCATVFIVLIGAWFYLVSIKAAEREEQA